MIKGWLNPNISPETSPEILLTQYQATGKNKYLSLLVAEFNQPIYHYLVSLSDQNIAEDTLQATWLKVINTRYSQSRYNQAQHSHVKSWLYTIARNTLIDELRRQQKWQWQPLEQQLLSTSDLSASFEAAQRLTKFNLAISQLPFHQREAFIFQQEGFSLLEICQLVDENFETVKSRVRYARKNIKNLLGAKP